MFPLTAPSGERALSPAGHEIQAGTAPAGQRTDYACKIPPRMTSGWVRKNVDDSIAAELRQVVRADYRIVVTGSRAH